MYIDTSCFVKLLRPETGSAAVAEQVSAADRVVVSPLTVCELLVAVQRDSPASSRRTQLRVMDRLLRQPPFELTDADGSLAAVVRRQTLARGSVFCRSLDRLHLATMELLGERHLLTADGSQAKAARALGFRVTTVDS